jgi:hypothetical protein
MPCRKNPSFRLPTDTSHIQSRLSSTNGQRSLSNHRVTSLGTIDCMVIGLSDSLLSSSSWPPCMVADFHWYSGLAFTWSLIAHLFAGNSVIKGTYGGNHDRFAEFQYKLPTLRLNWCSLYGLSSQATQLPSWSPFLA